MKTFDFYFDFGSPNCYLAYKALPDYFGGAAEAELKPCLLGGVFKATGNVSPFYRYAEVRGRLDYEMLEVRRFCEKHGLDAFTMNPRFPVNTLTLMRGLCAVSGGERRAYIDAVLAGMWEDGADMNDEAVVAARLDAGGLDGASILERTKEDLVKQDLIEKTNAAVARGVFGLPMFFVGEDMYFGKDRLAQVAEALAA